MTRLSVWCFFYLLRLFNSTNCKIMAALSSIVCNLHLMLLTLCDDNDDNLHFP
jgi:hypothetical protein